MAACWEFIIPKVGADVANIGALSFPKIIDICLHKHLLSCDTFEAFLEKVKEEIQKECDAICDGIKNLWFVPSPFMNVMIDGGIKLVNEEEHIKYTGVRNKSILTNIEWLKTSGKQFVFRVPLIPGITDTEANLKAISEIVGDCRVELMPYNPVAGAKYSMVGMEYELPDAKNRTEDYTRYFQNAILMA